MVAEHRDTKIAESRVVESNAFAPLKVSDVNYPILYSIRYLGHADTRNQWIAGSFNLKTGLSSYEGGMTYG
jgi:hypothetical protein